VFIFTDSPTGGESSSFKEQDTNFSRTVHKYRNQKKRKLPVPRITVRGEHRFLFSGENYFISAALDLIRRAFYCFSFHTLNDFTVKVILPHRYLTLPTTQAVSKALSCRFSRKDVVEKNFVIFGSLSPHRFRHLDFLFWSLFSETRSLVASLSLLMTKSHRFLLKKDEHLERMSER
jgi:hypothetical protein